MESNKSFTHKVRINWTSNQGTIWWNEICAMVLEVFGLPGNRYIYKPHMDYMEFMFTSNKDAILCKIMLSEKINA